VVAFRRGGRHRRYFGTARRKWLSFDSLPVCLQRRCDRGAIHHVWEQRIRLNRDVARSAKLIAVVYANMVGYSRLIGPDDAGTIERLKALRHTLIDPVIREYGGRLVQTSGDSLLIVFDSIDRAVRCALRVQQQLPVHDGDQPPDRTIRFRIGVNIGDVIADGTDLHGDAVNVAARLQSECPPGGICGRGQCGTICKAGSLSPSRNLGRLV
jgi:class 3 adenylate cyclase